MIPFLLVALTSPIAHAVDCLPSPSAIADLERLVPNAEDMVAVETGERAARHLALSVGAPPERVIHAALDADAALAGVPWRTLDHTWRARAERVRADIADSLRRIRAASPEDAAAVDQAAATWAIRRAAEQLAEEVGEALATGRIGDAR